MKNNEELVSKFLAIFRLTPMRMAYTMWLAVFAVSSAQAVHLDPRGLGEVLLFPYYTTTGKYDTYINLVNSSEETKAVKVRFRESMNGATVLEFNLYLAPLDHWSAAVYPRSDGPGAELRSADRSCTVPMAIANGEAIPFSNQDYLEDSNNGLARTHEGFVEVIEMAVISEGTDDWPARIRHRPSGNAFNCFAIRDAWEDAGAWSQDPMDGASRGSGGLYGYGVLIDVEEGTEATYDAVAIGDFTAPTASAMHTPPESSTPSLSSGDTQYQMLAGGSPIASAAESGIDAISALLMQATLSNDYVLEPSIGAGTDWVITLPTKNEYINKDPVLAPFTVAWDADDSSACEEFLVFDYFDREEGALPSELSTPFPGQPPFVPPTLELCAQANVVSLNGPTSGSDVLGASFERNGFLFYLEDGFVNGWGMMRFDFGRPQLEAGAFTFYGLPYIGFALQKYVNGSVEFEGGAVLSNYVGVVKHKGQQLIVESL